MDFRDHLSYMGSFQAAKTHCPHGHPYDEENTWRHNGQRYCRTCRREQAREYERSGRRVRTPEQRHKHLLRSVFGITPEDYAAMLDEQGGGCAICGGPEKANRKMPVDHDHESGFVRGLLCTACNVRLWALEQANQEWRAKAEAYLHKFTGMSQSPNG